MRPTHLATLALAVALAACADHVALPTAVPDAAPFAAKDVDVPSATYGRSNDGVIPTPVSGNTTDGGTGTTPSTLCSLYAPGSTASDQLDASSSVAGYRFTVSSDGTQLAFSPIGSGTPSSAIAAVLVKGGNGYDVYTYPNGGVTSDAGLVSPLNGGGNTPSISHYVACTVPLPAYRLTKRLVSYMTSVNGAMIPYTGQAIPIGSGGVTVWLDYVIDYALPPGVTATLTDNVQTACSTLPGFTCSTSGIFVPGQGFSSALTVSGTGSVMIMDDVQNHTGCGNFSLVNTAVLSRSGTTLASASAPPVTITGVCR